MFLLYWPQAPRFYNFLRHQLINSPHFGLLLKYYYYYCPCPWEGKSKLMERLATIHLLILVYCLNNTTTTATAVVLGKESLG
jgi:hypothetical protein